MEAGVPPYVANIDSTMALLRVGTVVFPVTINDREYENSYVCSPYTATITYPLEELAKLDSRLLRASLKAIICTMAPLLRAAQINKVVCVNNWLLSTNLYPDWNGDGLDSLTKMLCRHSPDRAIMFRSLNRATNERLCPCFADAGYHLVPSRLVYVFDGIKADFMRKQDTRRDQNLLRNTSYSVVGQETLTDEDDEAIVRLYDMLYLKKYSRHNPQFTARWVRLCRRERLLDLYGLRNEDGRLDGIVGCFSRNGVLSSPLVGYDTSLSIDLGLYRLLSALVLREAARRKMTLNMSSGVGEFKRLRGGVPHVEYSAVFYDHLPPHRRAVWGTLAMLLEQIGVRVLKKYEL